MGGKSSKSNLKKKSFHPSEEERVIRYFGLQSINDKISAANLKKKWQDLLVPAFMDQLVGYLVKQSNSEMITMDTMATVYVTFVRGTLDEIASAIAEVIGCRTKDENEVVASYKNVLKYVTDLISSYLKTLESRKDNYLMSWSLGSRKANPTSLLAVVNSWCAELEHENDEVVLYKLEQWLSHTGMVTLINSLLVTTLYNLNDAKTSLIPRAILPSPKTISMLDASQLIYVNSLLPSEYRCKWRFLFSTGTHGESFSTMMGNIVNQGPTLLVVRDNNDYTFGGFASDSWSPSPKFVGNETCLLFKLSPETKVFTSTGYNDHYMYVNCNQTSFPNGLGMGGQFGYWGLWLDSHFGNGECSESCTTYRNYEMLAASKKFNIRHLEIWGVGDPPPTAEELGERVSSVLDKDPTVTQMLEMIGRKQHSKGLRESPGRVKPMFPSQDSQNPDSSEEQDHNH